MYLLVQISDKFMRNTKKAMTWLQSKPSYDDLIIKISDIEKHIERCGVSHPLHSDFKNALFLLRQEEIKLKKSDGHLQRGLNFDDFELEDAVASPQNNRATPEIKPYTSRENRDAVFRTLRQQMDSIATKATNIKVN